MDKEKADLFHILLSSIEIELQRQIARLDEPRTQPLHEMLAYHMGWAGEGAGAETQGKRLRPLLVLLTTAACNAKWEHALPAAAAIELIHNFSLIHDDVQDNSPLRRGRPTVWKKWGVAQAINAGDALFVLAHMALSALRENFTAEQAFRSEQVIHNVCLDLTRGQFLDLHYEGCDDLTLEDYWTMIAGKTAALFSASAQVGAILGAAGEAAEQAYRDFGHYLGLTFQVQDDILGIWGDSARMGKSNESDLVSGKKSLPVLHGLSRAGEFARRRRQGRISAEEVPGLSEQLAREGARAFAQDQADRLMDLAIQSLRQADAQGEAAEALFTLVGRLLNRQL